MRPLTAYRLPLTLFCTIACGTLPPLRGRIDVGHESYAIFVGGSGVGGDLYAVRGDGGPAYQITYTTVAELRPALSPDGAEVAFFRGQSLRDSTPATLWVLNLLNGADRELRLPKDAGLLERVGWRSDGNALLVKTSKDLYRVEAPPAKPNARSVPPGERAAAESSLAVLLGDPVFARVVPCSQAEDLCVIPRSGRPGILAQAATDP
ncbi:MAG: TolB family protein, partial [Gemmatimonadales bacterium]